MKRMLLMLVAVVLTNCNYTKSNSSQSDITQVVLLQKVRELQQRVQTLEYQIRVTQAVIVSELQLEHSYILRNVKITFYSNDKYSINVEKYRDGLTATGIPVTEGVAAVDPNVIPYGSVLYIPQLKKFFIAADTGSAIKGKHIDIYQDSRKKALQRGVMYCDVIVCGKVSLDELRESVEVASNK